MSPMDAGPSFTPVGKTAMGVAVLRAQESCRPDRLFDDPYAHAFVDAAPGIFPADAHNPEGIAPLGALFGFHVAMRTRFFDDYLLTAAADGCRQVVLLAAGLDTRAFRLSWPSATRLFELDLPDVLAFKDSVLDRQRAVARCDRTTLAVDLCADWATTLTDAGFDPEYPTAWLAEGLLAYLSPNEVAQLLSTVGELSARASAIAFEHGYISDAAALVGVPVPPETRDLAALWKGGLGQQTPAWLAGRGWEVTLHAVEAVAASHHRVPPRHAAGTFAVGVRGVPARTS